MTKCNGVGKFAKCKRPFFGIFFFNTLDAHDGGWYGCDVSGDVDVDIDKDIIFEEVYRLRIELLARRFRIG